MLCFLEHGIVIGIVSPLRHAGIKWLRCIICKTRTQYHFSEKCPYKTRKIHRSNLKYTLYHRANISAHANIGFKRAHFIDFKVLCFFI